MTCPAVDHVERWLFANPRKLEPAADGRGIEIVAAAGVTQEIESLARRIKRLLVDGDAAAGEVRPSDILVVFRSLADTADRLRQVFAEFGIPLVIGAERTLHQAPLMSALVAWLRLKLDNWPFRQLLAVLGHNYFRPTCAVEKRDRGCRRRAPRAAFANPRRLPAAVRRCRPRQNTPPATKPPPTIEQCTPATTHSSPGRFWTAWTVPLDALPQHATLTEWSAAIAALAQDVGLLTAAQNGPAASAALDLAAWQTLTDALNDFATLADWTGEEPARLTLADFVAQLEEVLRCERLPLDADETGRVRRLVGRKRAHLAAPYVFVAGLSERAFPSHQREDCLASELERGELHSAGLPLAGPTERGQNEMLLFYEVVTRATRRLVLSYPAIDAAAQPLSPSPYLAELERACGEGRVERHVEPRLAQRAAG